MRKIIVSINVTPEGFCDHSAVIADDELHNFACGMLRKADTVLLGKNTYELFESHWPAVAQNKKGTEPEIEFGELIDDMHKIVFSKTLKAVSWKNTNLCPAVDKKKLHELKDKKG